MHAAPSRADAALTEARAFPASDNSTDKSGALGHEPATGDWSPNQRRLVLRIVAVASVPLIVLVVIGIVQGKALAEARVAEERVALAQAGALTATAFVEGNLATA